MSILPPLERKPDGGEAIHPEIRRVLALEAGRRRPEDPFPSERSISRTYGINRLTVRKAVDALVQEGVLYRIERRGTFVAPPRTASRRFALVCCDHPSGAPGACEHAAICRAFRDEAQISRHQVLPLSDRPASGDGLEARIARHRPDAVLFCHPRPALELEILRLPGPPALRVGVWLSPGTVDTVAADAMAAAHAACGHLADLGHLRIGLVGRPAPSGTGDGGPAWGLLAEGCELACRARGVELPAGSRILARTPTRRRRRLLDLLRRSDAPTAIVALGSRSASEAIACAERAHRVVPGELSVIAVRAAPPRRRRDLAAVDVDLREVGRLALRVALLRLEDPGRPPFTALTRAVLRPGPSAAAPRR